MSDWRSLSISLPAEADDELTNLLTQAAADAGALGGQVDGGTLTLYLPREADHDAAQAVRDKLQEAAALLGFEAGSLAIREAWLPDAPWATAWKDRFETFPLGRRLLIRPDWDQGEVADRDWAQRLSVWIKPGQGFGTGHHETTRLALAWLEEELRPGMAVLDFGSGSGILAIAAKRLGAGRTVGVECDPDANENARENLALNDLTGQVELIESDSPAAATGRFDLIVCNMLPQHALRHFALLAARLAGPESRLIYGGYLADEKEEPDRALTVAGLTPLAFRHEGEWGACLAGPAPHAQHAAAKRE